MRLDTVSPSNSKNVLEGEPEVSRKSGMTGKFQASDSFQNCLHGLRQVQPFSMKLTNLIQSLEEIHPLSLAADWDPVGLQIEPHPDADVQRILITLDLTSAVVQEAVDQQANLIIAYHPPLFVMPDRLTQNESKSRILLKCIQSGIAVYSPHTVLDGLPDGVTDWLAQALGAGTSTIIEAHPTLDNAGHGRLVTLSTPADAQSIAESIQAALDIPWVRTAVPSGTPRPIQRIAVCPGAGHSVIESAQAEALLTGEMRHHDLLDALEKGQTVFLCEHAASERGYLSVYAETIRELVGDGVPVEISQTDQGPLTEIVTG